MVSNQPDYFEIMHGKKHFSKIPTQKLLDIVLSTFFNKRKIIYRNAHQISSDLNDNHSILATPRELDLVLKHLLLNQYIIDCKDLPKGTIENIGGSQIDITDLEEPIFYPTLKGQQIHFGSGFTGEKNWKIFYKGVKISEAFLLVIGTFGAFFYAAKAYYDNKSEEIEESELKSTIQLQQLQIELQNQKIKSQEQDAVKYEALIESLKNKKKP